MKIVWKISDLLNFILKILELHVCFRELEEHHGIG